MLVISLEELNEEKVKLINSLGKIVELRFDLIFFNFLAQNKSDFLKQANQKKTLGPEDKIVQNIEEQKEFLLNKGLDADLFLSLFEKELFPLIKQITVPLIATLRKKSAGGMFLESEEARFSILKKILTYPFAYVDIEQGSPNYFFDYFRKYYPGVKIICSYHNFESTPSHEELEKIFSLIAQVKPDIYKVATTAQSSIDALSMLCFVKKKALEGYLVSGICMGERGSLTRILSPVAQGYFSYCKLDNATALGQLTVDEMERRYGFNYLNAKTKIYGLIGKDVSKSPSHRTHNKIFSLENFKSIYVKIPIEKEELPSFFQMIKKLPFFGLSVTSPYKEEVLKFIDGKASDIEDIKAVNTLVNENGSYIGYNTDGKAALDAIEKKTSIQGKKMVILGAGGSARAIAFEGKKRGAKVCILNRIKEKALAISRDLKVEGDGLDLLPKIFEKGYDILINATSSSDPIEKKYIFSQSLVMDINYLPHPTPFLIKAQEKGCIIIFGFEMFVYQAKGQLKLWDRP